MTTERKLNGIWNAERILHEYLYFSHHTQHFKKIDHTDDSPNGIRMRRFDAVLKAYGKDVSDFCENGWIISQACSQERIDELRQLLSQFSDDYTIQRLLNHPRTFRNDRDIRYMFRVLFEYRVALYKVEDFWSGHLEGTQSVALIYYTTRQLYENHIQSICKLIDKLLVLLMGDDFERSFTEEELLPFGYPDITDDELRHMIVDNF